MLSKSLDNDNVTPYKLTKIVEDAIEMIRPVGVRLITDTMSIHDLYWTEAVKYDQQCQVLMQGKTVVGHDLPADVEDVLEEFVTQTGNYANQDLTQPNHAANYESVNGDLAGAPRVLVPIAAINNGQIGRVRAYDGVKVSTLEMKQGFVQVPYHSIHNIYQAEKDDEVESLFTLNFFPGWLQKEENAWARPRVDKKVQTFSLFELNYDPVSAIVVQDYIEKSGNFLFGGPERLPFGANIREKTLRIGHVNS